MKVVINGLELSEATVYKLSDQIDGIAKPPIRTSSSNYSGRDGGFVSSQFYAGRLLSISGFIYALTCEAHDSARTALADALPIDQDLAVTIETFSGGQFVTSGRLQNFQNPYTHAKSSDFKLDLFCGDPNFYIGDEQSLAIPLYVGGGATLPWTLPIKLAAGTGPVTALNGGSVVVYPVLTITGAAHNPEITNVDTGEKVEIDITTSPGDVMVINMAPKLRIVTLNGGSVIDHRSLDSVWFGMAPGSNRFRFETTDGGDTATAVMTWRNAVWSI